ncbi:MAG: hypothetical protein U1A27_10210 [Phycisphaerae bacterium]
MTGASLATAHDYDGDQVWVERHPDHHVASYLYGPAGPAARTLLNGSTEGLCVQWLLSDGVGNTSGAVDSAGNIVLQHFDAFGVPIDRIALATTNPPTAQAACSARSCDLCNGGYSPGSRDRAATGHAPRGSAETDSRPFTHPCYISAFVLIGDPG